LILIYIDIKSIFIYIQAFTVEIDDSTAFKKKMISHDIDIKSDFPGLIIFIHLKLTTLFTKKVLTPNI